MNNMTKRIGILIILIGLCAFLTSFAFLPEYNHRVGFLVNINHTDLILKEGKWVRPDIFDEIVTKEKGVPFNKVAHWEGRIALPYKYFIIADIIFIFLGIVILLLSKSDKSIK